MLYVMLYSQTEYDIKIGQSKIRIKYQYAFSHPPESYGKIPCDIGLPDTALAARNGDYTRYPL
jgi:hypothetical protein